MIATLLVLAIAIATVGDATQGPRAVARPPAAKVSLIVPLHVHVLSSRDLTLADCKLRDADITRIVGNAFFFHELPMNGSALVDDIVIVTEQAQLNPVEGGIDEPIPRVLGFTIGVALGLEARRVPETSLLALGTTGTDLSAGDVDRARRVANTVTGVMTIDEAQKAAAAHAYESHNPQQSRRVRQAQERSEVECVR
jgi:hypothetical protein